MRCGSAAASESILKHKIKKKYCIVVLFSPVIVVLYQITYRNRNQTELINILLLLSYHGHRSFPLSIATYWMDK
jgi:hypothetical protein